MLFPTRWSGRGEKGLLLSPLYGETTPSPYLPFHIAYRRNRMVEKKAATRKPVRLSDEDVNILRTHVLTLEEMIKSLPKCNKTTSLLINVEHLKKKLSPRGKSILREKFETKEE
jgi:hypothetical protein